MSSTELILLYAVVGMGVSLLFLNVADTKGKLIPFQAIVPVMVLWPAVLTVVGIYMLKEKSERKNRHDKGGSD